MASDRSLDDLERAVRFNTRLTTALLALFVLLLAGAGGYAWWRASRLLEPEHLVQTAEDEIQENYPEIRAELKKAIVQNAPEIAEELSRRGRRSVPEARRLLEGYAERKIDAGLEQATAFSAGQFRELLRDNRELILAAYGELGEASPEQRRAVARLERELGESLGASIRKDARLVLGFLYLMLDKLQALDRGEEALTPRERAERRIVRLLRAMEKR